MRFFIFVILFLNNAVFADNPTLVSKPPNPVYFVNTGFNPPISDILKSLASNAFHRIGSAVSFKAMPAERSLQLVVEGFDDAECCRIPEVVKKDYPDLIPVPESLYHVTFSAFIINPDIEISGWKDLASYSVGTVKGYKILVNKAQEAKPAKLTLLDNPRSMMRMLELGRLDIAILGFEDGLDALKKLGIERKDVKVLTLIRKPLHIMLNQKHGHLLEALNDSIKQMKNEGEILRLTEQVLNAGEGY